MENCKVRDDERSLVQPKHSEIAQKETNDEFMIGQDGEEYPYDDTAPNFDENAIRWSD